MQVHRFVGSVMVGLGVLLAAADRPLAQEFDPRSTVGLYGYASEDASAWSGVRTRSLTRAFIPNVVNLSERMPPPVQQLHNSCVSFSVGYALRGYYAALRNGVEPGTREFTPSPAYLHARVRNKAGPCDTTGASIRAALVYFTTVGAPTRAQFPDEMICSAEVEQDTQSSDFKTEGAYGIFIRSEDQPNAGPRDLDLIKQVLASGHPVAAGFRLFRVEPSTGLPPETTTLAFLKEGGIYRGSLEPHGGEVGGHAMLIVGFDEDRQAFLLQNSWGPKWADGGFGWISYEAMQADLDVAGVMDPGFDPMALMTPPEEPVSPQPPAVADTCSQLLAIDERQDPNRQGAQQTIPIYAGFVSSPQSYDTLVAQYGQASVSNVDVRPWPVCEALLTLEQPLQAAERPVIRMLAGRTTVRYGDSLAFEVTAPDHAAFLYVIYLTGDGTAVNLLPRNAPVRRQAQPGEVLVFGDGQNGRQRYEAGPPSGNEAIIVIASRSPLAQLEDLEDSGSGQYQMPAGNGPDDASLAADDRYFLSILRKDINDHPGQDTLRREVAAAVQHLTIQPR